MVTSSNAINVRGSTNIEEQIKQNQSLWLDIKILFKTPFVTIKGKGAY